MNRDFASKTQGKKKSKRTLQIKTSVFCLIVGLVIGSVSTYEWLVNEKKPHTALQLLAKFTKKTPQAEPKSKPVPPPPKFDFYTMLPNMKIEAGATQKTETAKTAKPSAPPSTQDGLKRHYYLQVAALNNFTEANTLRATLLMKGFNAKINRINHEGGHTLYRVWVGPFRTLSTVQRSQKILTENHLESLLLYLPITG